MEGRGQHQAYSLALAHIHTQTHTNTHKREREREREREVVMVGGAGGGESHGQTQTAGEVRGSMCVHMYVRVCVWMHEGVGVCRHLRREILVFSSLSIVCVLILLSSHHTTACRIPVKTKPQKGKTIGFAQTLALLSAMPALVRERVRERDV